jgi:hypothetical protein
MATATLDHLVKGAPAAGTPAAAYNAAPAPAPPKAPLSDPTSLLPSSPPQIYLNLLILEASLRSQYLTLRARRRQNTFVLTLLAVWIACFFYLLWLRPRDDGKGIGGSQYWLLDMLQKVGFITGVVTALLFWATGQWERGVRWPRRWIGITNRGLRGINAKIVVIRGPWWRELAEWLAFVVPFGGGLWGGEQGGSSYHFINTVHEKSLALDTASRPRTRIIEDGKEYAEEDIAPGGDYIKLLLLPKPFTPDFRQNWELYRAEYWERENERRAELRKRVRARRREIARANAGCLWWTGWRGWKRPRTRDVERASSHAHAHSLSHGRAHSGSLSRRRRPSSLMPQQTRSRETSHSRSSSRSSVVLGDEREREQRRGSLGAHITAGAGSGAPVRKASGLAAGAPLARPHALRQGVVPGDAEEVGRKNGNGKGVEG